MALDQNAKYPVGTLPATAAYPEGSAVNSTAPGALDGYPLEKDQLNDRFGLEQALLRSSGQAASGLPDTALASQYLESIIELAAGRAINYDESGIADAYVLDAQANQQAINSLFDGLRFESIAGNAPTGASTLEITGVGGVKSLKNNDGKALTSNYFAAGDIIRGQYDLAAGEYRLDRPSGGEYIKVTDTQASGVDGGSTSTAAFVTRRLSTIDNDAGALAALGSNQITLQAGTYIIKASAPAFDTIRHKIKLRNISDATDEIMGTSEIADATNDGSNRSFMSGRFTITAAKIFEIQHYTQVAKATEGFGVASDIGGISEVYTIVELWKVK